ncbi:HAD family hydrolase [Agrobacterium rhizogenes]|uniref:HAD hydrolase, IA, variant 1 family protein n=1 Tax=Rhizobium rhizogenes TaxID=359 RepID=A0A7S4ZVA2_RHIRH|nr:HAD family hydrolase [Rhizobium rhizogenes]NTF59376.1 HAD family hydrolase [Rhizobium rhizogenes]NTF78961.1 HAD family hydrolase [Rhizobium rhizogenes]NTJ51490.1 HAD family hydrolase [Rhizobium rhizogenes]QCL10231.1 HAD hydrolase, IA, variant 1 family protein [Rhizobium rhizogenes]
MESFNNRSLFDRGFDAILFDMDGTLVDSTVAVERTWKRWAEKHGLDLESILKASHGMRTIETVRRFAPPDIDPEKEAGELEASEIADVDGIVAVPGAQELLKSLPTDRWAIVTSASRELAARRLSAASLWVPEVIVTANDVSAGKPNPEGYEKAAAYLGVSCKNCLIIEDAHAGIKAAENAGASVLVVTATHRTPITTFYVSIRNFQEIRSTLDQTGQIVLTTIAHDGGIA